MKRGGTHGVFILLLIVLSCALLSISIMVPVIPLSYDEAWNYTNISSKGPLYAATNFPFANNHVFFTLLQAVTVPQKLLPGFPEATRTLNVCVSVALFALLYFFFVHVFHKKSPLWFVVITACCFFASPLVTPFFIISRGYLLGMLLLLLGVYFLCIKRYYRAALFFILSGWTVVTYVYCLPLIYLSAFYINKRVDWGKILLSALFIPIGLYIVYKPILLTVLTQGTLWNTESLSAFFFSQWRSLSNLSNLPYGNMGNGLFTAAYILSIIMLLRKRYFVLLNSAVASYLIVVGVLSLTRIAHPPYERAGLFIPIIAAVNLLGAAFIAKSTWIRYLLWLILCINVLTGIYFFATGLPGIEYLSPVPYPVSPQERQLLKEKKVPYLTLSRPEDEPFLQYFSHIYSIPVHTIHKGNPVPVPPINQDKQPIILSLVTKEEPSPGILPTNPLYPLKRVWQYASLQAIEFFTITKTPHIRYLLSLSDITYAEADSLWEQGKHDVALKTLARGEHDITLTTGETRDVLGITNNKEILRDILSSIALHQKIIIKMLTTGKGKDINALLDIISFSNRNLETVLSFAVE